MRAYTTLECLNFGSMHHSKKQQKLEWKLHSTQKLETYLFVTFIKSHFLRIGELLFIFNSLILIYNETKSLHVFKMYTFIYEFYFRNMHWKCGSELFV